MKGILNRRQLCNKKNPQNTHVYIKEQLFNVNKIYFQFLKKFKKKNTGINTIIYFNYLIS